MQNCLTVSYSDGSDLANAEKRITDVLVMIVRAALRYRLEVNGDIHRCRNLSRDFDLVSLITFVETEKKMHR